jgi:hypothetical protein
MYEEMLQDYVEAIQVAFDTVAYGRSCVFVERGRRFDRIAENNGVQRMVHVFVDRTNGDVIKAAGWKSPQRTRDGRLAVRYNLSNLAEWQTKIDPYGGYLYEK